jgi:hypothetical protein
VREQVGIEGSFVVFGHEGGQRPRLGVLALALLDEGGADRDRVTLCLREKIDERLVPT